jgi:hypothetical protein
MELSDGWCKVAPEFHHWVCLHSPHQRGLGRGLTETWTAAAAAAAETLLRSPGSEEEEAAAGGMSTTAVAVAAEPQPVVTTQLPLLSVLP